MYNRIIHFCSKLLFFAFLFEVEEEETEQKDS